MSEVLREGNLQNLGFNLQWPTQFTFDQAKRLVIQKSTITAVDEALRSWGLSSLEDSPLTRKYQARTFLTAFLISGYPKDILDDRFIPVYFFAREVVKAYHNYILNGNLESLKITVSSYWNIYREWETHDRQKLINDLLVQYYDLDHSKDQIQRQPFTNLTESMVSDRQQVIINRLKTLRADNEIDRWNQIGIDKNLSKRELLYTIKSETLTGFEYYSDGDDTQIIGKMAFWDHFSDILEQEMKTRTSLETSDQPTPRYGPETIYTTIEAFKTQMFKLTPKAPALKAHYDEYLDTEYIQQLLESGIFSRDHFDRLVRFSCEQIRNLDSDYGSQQIDQWLTRWDSISKCSYDIYEVLPWVMRDFLNKVERLTGMFNLYKNSTSE